VRIDPKEAFWDLLGAACIPRSHQAEKLQLLALETVRRPGTGQPRGRKFGVQVEPEGEIGLQLGLHPLLQLL
jgi:hypothetical protein